MRWLVLAAFVAGPGLACEGAPLVPEVPGGAKLRAALPDPLPLSQPFDITVEVCAGAVDGIEVDAIMPAHQHGMNYAPEVTQTGEGLFAVTGMVFHMPGVWRLSVGARDGDAVSYHSLEVTAR